MYMNHGHIHKAYQLGTVQNAAKALQFSKHSKLTNDENSSHPTNSNYGIASQRK